MQKYDKNGTVQNLKIQGYRPYSLSIAFLQISRSVELQKIRFGVNLFRNLEMVFRQKFEIFGIWW